MCFISFQNVVLWAVSTVIFITEYQLKDCQLTPPYPPSNLTSQFYAYIIHLYTVVTSTRTLKCVHGSQINVQSLLPI